MEHLEKVFKKLSDKNWKVAEEKAHFCLSQVKLLGKIVNGFGITPDPEVLNDMKNFPIPRNGKHVLQFLGLCGVYRDFIQDWSKLSKDLYKLTHKNSQWNWGEIENTAFQNLKAAMLKPSILKHPDFTKDFYIFSDASAIGGGAVLCQQHNDTFFPVSYTSWIFDSKLCESSQKMERIFPSKEILC